MTSIIAGRFEQGADAEAAAAALRRDGFAADDVTVFFVNPPGQHGTFPIGGDRDESPGAKHAEAGALTGVAAGGAVGAGVGLAALPVLGPAAVLAAAAAGAYAGSLLGALGDMKDTPAKASTTRDSEGVAVASASDQFVRVRAGGMLVSVRAVEFANRVSAVNILRGLGARDIERADGAWQAGHWIDFDPLKPLVLVDLPADEDASMRSAAD
jgi:hypothetical protein